MCSWGGVVGWLFFLQPIQYDSSHFKEIKWEKEIMKINMLIKTYIRNRIHNK